jgi:tetratricopeptide (TPR) repeat protein
MRRTPSIVAPRMRPDRRASLAASCAGARFIGLFSLFSLFAILPCLPAIAAPSTAQAAAASPTENIAAIDDPEHALALPAELRARLQSEVLAGATSPGRRFEALVRFVHAPEGLGLRYDNEATRSVAEAYAARRANCVSFTLLFLALAREAGLDVRPQRIRRILSWRQEAGTLYLNSHVFAHVRIGVREYAVDFTTEPVVARDPPEAIDTRQLLGHYYNNRAMEALARQDGDTAERLLRIALRLDPAFAPHWSNAGVVRHRAGDPAGAARAYAEALARDPEETGALFNSIGLARREGDARRSDAFERRLARVQAKDPFHHFLRGRALMDEGRAGEAIAHYRQAIRLHRGEPRFHAALAEAAVAAGDLRGADRALERAIALSDGDARALLQRTREALRERTQLPARPAAGPGLLP